MINKKYTCMYPNHEFKQQHDDEDMDPLFFQRR